MKTFSQFITEAAPSAEMQSSSTNFSYVHIADSIISEFGRPGGTRTHIAMLKRHAFLFLF